MPVSGLSPRVRGRLRMQKCVTTGTKVYPRVCGVDSLVFNVFNAMRGLFMQIAYLFSGRIVFGFRRSGH